jgi:transcriptional regulator with XRE-family HTH domain
MIQCAIRAIGRRQTLMPTRGRDRARTDAQIAETIRELTEDYSQKDLADLLGVDPSAVSRALAGKRAFNLREVALIADWIGVDADSILFSRESMLAWRCDAGDVCEDAAHRCREAVKDFLAFRTVAT